MNILCIESSGEICSVALSRHGKTIAFLETVKGLQHAEILASYAQNIIKENLPSLKSLDAVAVSKGPGSYTGLRIGYSFAKGLCYALNIPLIGIDTLYILAYHCKKQVHHNNLGYIPMIDARRMEVYMNMYDTDLQVIMEPAAVILDNPETIDFFVQQTQSLVVTGNGSTKFQDIIQQHNLQISTFQQSLSSTMMSEIAQKYYTTQKFEDVAYSVPFYLKNFIATTLKKSFFSHP